MRSTGPDDPTPDTAMASGPDAAEPGGHLGPGDLSPDEERLLAALERDARGGPGLPSDAPAAVPAAEDDRPPPDRGSAPDDGLTPRFMPPGEG